MLVVSVHGSTEANHSVLRWYGWIVGASKVTSRVAFGSSTTKKHSKVHSTRTLKFSSQTTFVSCDALCDSPSSTAGLWRNYLARGSNEGRALSLCKSVKFVTSQLGKWTKLAVVPTPISRAAQNCQKFRDATWRCHQTENALERFVIFAFPNTLLHMAVSRPTHL